MAGLLDLPSTDPASLGPDRVDKKTYMGSVQRVPAVFTNRLRDFLIALGQMIGLADGSTSGSLQQRMAALDPLINMPSYGTIRRLSLIDNFLHTSDALGGFATNQSGTNASSGSDTTTTAGRIGIVYCRTGDTATGWSQLYTYSTIFQFGAGRVCFRADVRVPALSTVAEQYRIFSGFHDGNINTDGTDGAGFRYTDSLNGGCFQFVTRAASVETVTNTTVQVVANTWYVLEIDVSADASQVIARINGVIVATHTTNIPSGAAATGAMAAGIAKLAGTTSRAIYTDLAAWSYDLTTPL